MPDHPPDRLGRGFPVLSSVRDHPGAILGTAAALAILCVGAALPAVVPGLSLRDALFVSGLVGSFPVGAGLGYDTALRKAEAQRMFAVGAVLNIFGFVGLAAGTDLVLLVVGPLAFALKSIWLGRRLSIANPR